MIEDELDGVGLIHLVERLLASHLAVLWYVSNGTTKDDLLFDVQEIPVINFNPSQHEIEPLRGIWIIEPLTKKFYFVRAQSVPS